MLLSSVTAAVPLVPELEFDPEEPETELEPELEPEPGPERDPEPKGVADPDPFPFRCCQKCGLSCKYLSFSARLCLSVPRAGRSVDQDELRPLLWLS